MSHVFVPGKTRYVRGDRPRVKCILCAVHKNNPKVANLKIFTSNLFVVTLNLYPYGPGHLMIFPIRHIKDIRSLSKKEEEASIKIQQLSLNVLDEFIQPHGYNMGLNIGRWSGASIPHLHWHIVPRFKNEIGFLDICAGTRLIVDAPVKSRAKLAKLFKKHVRKHSYTD